MPVKSWGVQGSQIPGAESKWGGMGKGVIKRYGASFKPTEGLRGDKIWWVSANPTHTCLQGYIFIANSMVMLHFTKRLRATIVYLFLSKGLIQVIPGNPITSIFFSGFSFLWMCLHLDMDCHWGGVKGGHAWWMVNCHEETSGHPPDSQTPGDSNQKILARFFSLPAWISHLSDGQLGGFNMEVLSYICDHPC